ncbi:MAG: alpha-galactosidase [Candidatus Hydrogenedentes bacterium]|nr:alpha-galactosidase [Candidatus Hydrogenedentota bacterium]
MRVASYVVLGVILALASSVFARAVEPVVDELATAQQWAETKFGESGAAFFPNPGIEVLANHNAVQKNGRFGVGLRIGETSFERGLYCHASSKLIVRLPGAGKRFRATVGVDLNNDTSNGQGSIVFVVLAGGKELFRSGVIHGKDAGVPVDVPLNGASEIVLAIEDGGDGISSDQGDWGNACFTLDDGKEVWLDELPMPGGFVLLDAGTLPFSFVYNGKPFAEQASAWDKKVEKKKLDGNGERTRHVVTWTEPASKLEVRAVAVSYRDYPVVEWTLHFKNKGAADTAILENIQALDVRMERGDRGEFTLHHARGSSCRQDDFEPLTTQLGVNGTMKLAPEGGRSASGVMPYFNVEGTCMDGALVAVGWPAQWAATFARDAERGLHLVAGQELTHFKLLPGEEVRSPLVAVQFWKGDRIRSQNLWRQWMFAYGMTRPNGQPPQPQFLASSSRAYEEMIKADSASQMMFIDRFFEEGIKLDYWWMDAGWYVQQNGWPQVGTWEVDQKRFPGGLRPISDHAHAKGVKILVWFEPERVAPGTWLTENHPEWIIGGANGGLLDFGNPEAWNWVTNHVDTLIKEQGIDLYRQDFNIDPLNLWRGRDAEDRQGISEIKHCMGLLAYWDELIKRHPGLLIDTCASGGRRIDLECARRAVPLWRSDYAFEPIGHQGMTYGLSYWLPYHGTGTVACANAGYYGGGKTPVESYAFWSNAAPSLGCGIDMRVKDIDYPAFRSLLEQWRSVAPYYYGDFYPLTSYSLKNDAWMVWQFHMSDSQEGMVQVFRRGESVFVSGDLALKGLDAGATYEIRNTAGGEPVTMDGKSLMEKGLRVTVDEKPGVCVYAYRKK